MRYPLKLPENSCQPPAFSLFLLIKKLRQQIERNNFEIDNFELTSRRLRLMS
jgi:hypothetical protein